MLSRVEHEKSFIISGPGLMMCRSLSESILFEKVIRRQQKALQARKELILILPSDFKGSSGYFGQYMRFWH